MSHPVTSQSDQSRCLNTWQGVRLHHSRGKNRKKESQKNETITDVYVYNILLYVCVYILSIHPFSVQAWGSWSLSQEIWGIS